MPAVVVRTPFTRRRVVAAAGGVAAVWGAARLAVWSAARREDGTPTPPGWRDSAPSVTVSLPNGGVYSAENTLAREAVERALPAVNAAAGGGFRIDAFEVAMPADATTQVPSLLPFLASGAPPDLLVFAGWPDPGAPQPDFAGAATSGFFRPLDAPLARDRALPLADFYPAALDLCRHKGALLGVPLLAAPIQLWYDRPLFEAAGVPAPAASWAWPQLLDAARRLTDTADADDANHRYGLSPGWRAGTLLSLIWQRGGDVTSPDRKRAVLDGPAARDAAAFFAGFYGGQPVSARAPQSLAFYPDGLYLNSHRWRTAMAYESAAWAYRRTSKPATTYGDPIAMAELPQGAHRATALGIPATLSLGKKARDPAVAAAALARLADYATKAAVPPPRRVQPAAMQALAPAMPPDALRALANALGYARAALLDDLSRTLDMHRVLSAAASALRLTSRAPLDVVQTANRDLQTILDRT